MKERTRQGEGVVVFSLVRNTVLFVNPEVLYPLQLKVGESSPLGIFADRAYRPSSGIQKGALSQLIDFIRSLALPPMLHEIQPQQNDGRVLQVWDGHSRSIRAGQALFADKQGRVYRDIDLKGIGYVDVMRGGYATVSNPGRLKSDGGRDGLLDRDTAFPAWEWAEEFVRAGIRTYRILAIIGLEELIVDGKRIDLEEARRRNIVDEEFCPVVEVRAFGTKDRIRDLESSPDSTKPLLIEEAKKLVARELKIPSLSTEQYVLWFARMLGYNVGLLHKNGWYHGYLSTHNITLDCRIVDLDSVRKLVSNDQHMDDLDNAWEKLQALSHSINSSGGSSDDRKLREQFQRGYKMASGLAAQIE